MAKVLLINPNKWGRGITHIWIPSHTSVLRGAGHNVKLFDCSFYTWTKSFSRSFKSKISIPKLFV